MHFIDTHAHLDDPCFTKDLDAIIARAHEVHVTRIISIGTGIKSNRAALALTEQYPSVYTALGIHPTNVLEEEDDWIQELRALAVHPKVVAIGEIGLDYHHIPLDTSPSFLKTWREKQLLALEQQLMLAQELGLNVIIHQRDLSSSQKKELSSDSPLHDYNAWEDTLKIMNSYQGKVRGVFHCFGGTPEQAEQVIAQGHLISFTGIITFKNASLTCETAKRVKPGHYMIETDSPYLAPTPYRGKRAEPAHVYLVAQKIADLQGRSLEEVAISTTETAEKFFRFFL
jgi:TatD DNase family protein